MKTEIIIKTIIKTDIRSEIGNHWFSSESLLNFMNYYLNVSNNFLSFSVIGP